NEKAGMPANAQFEPAKGIAKFAPPGTARPAANERFERIHHLIEGRPQGCHRSLTACRLRSSCGREPEIPPPCSPHHPLRADIWTVGCTTGLHPNVASSRVGRDL